MLVPRTLQVWADEIDAVTARSPAQTADRTETRRKRNTLNLPEESPDRRRPMRIGFHLPLDGLERSEEIEIRPSRPSERPWIPSHTRKKSGRDRCPAHSREQDYGPETIGPVPVGTAGMTGVTVKMFGPLAEARPSGLQVEGSSCVPGIRIDRKAEEPSKE